MGFRKILPGMLLVFFSCGTAHSSEWKYLGASPDGRHTLSIDVASIRINGEIRLAWFKSEYARSLKVHDAGGPDSEKVWSYSLGRYGFNCASETYQVDASVIVYYTDGTHGSDSAFNRLPWQPVPPDTFMERQMQFICGWKPS
jgi:hypothetical protein